MPPERKSNMKRNRTRPQDTAVGGEDNILCLLRQQNELLAEMRSLLRKIAAENGKIGRKPRQSREQLRQLSIALDALKKDPLHNVKKAAEFAYRNAEGYSSAKSLEVVLRKRWNSREE